MQIMFHEQAATRFNELAQELLTKAARLGPVPTELKGATSPRPVVRIDEQDLIGKPEWKGRSVNGYGDETGRHWDSSSGCVGYEGDTYLAVKELASRLAKAAPLKGKVSEDFLLGELSTWLEETLSSKRSDRLIDFLTEEVVQGNRSARVVDTCLPDVLIAGNHVGRRDVQTAPARNARSMVFPYSTRRMQPTPRGDSCALTSAIRVARNSCRLCHCQSRSNPRS